MRLLGPGRVGIRFAGSRVRYPLLVGLAGWLLASAASAEEGWIRFVGVETCLAEVRCDTPSLQLILRDLPVRGVRFEVQDRSRRGRGGVISARIDDYVLTDGLKIRDRRRPFRFDVSGVRGRTLVFEPEEGSELHIGEIEVLYGGLESFQRRGRERIPAPPPPVREAWDKTRSAYGGAAGSRRRGLVLQEVGCLGGSCLKSKVSIRLTGAPVAEIRFFARGGPNGNSDGKLRVLLDGVPILPAAEVPGRGKHFRLNPGGRQGQELSFEPAVWKAVHVEQLRVSFGEEGGRRVAQGRVSAPASTTSCLGGEVCGRNWSMEIPIAASDQALRFFAEPFDSTQSARVKVARRQAILLEATARPGGEFFEVDLEGAKSPSGRNESSGYVVLEALRNPVFIEEIELFNGSTWRRYRPASEGP